MTARDKIPLRVQRQVPQSTSESVLSRKKIIMIHTYDAREGGCVSANMD